MKILFIFLVFGLTQSIYSQKLNSSKEILLDSIKYYRFGLEYDSTCFYAEYFEYNNEGKIIHMHSPNDTIKYNYYPEKYEIYSFKKGCPPYDCNELTKLSTEKYSTIYFNSKGLDTLICDSIISESSMVSPAGSHYLISIDNYYRFYDSNNRDTLDLYIIKKCISYNSITHDTFKYNNLKKVTFYNDNGLDTLSIIYKVDSMQFWVRKTFFESGLDTTFIIYEANLSYPIKNIVDWYTSNKFMKSYNSVGQLIKYATSWYNSKYLENFDYYYNEFGKLKVVYHKELNYKKFYYYSNESSEILIKYLTKGLIISPNPVKDNLYINSPNDILKFNLVDLNGRIIISGKKCQNPIKISHINSGIYFLNIQTETCNYISKIIKY